MVKTLIDFEGTNTMQKDNWQQGKANPGKKLQLKFPGKEFETSVIVICNSPYSWDYTQGRTQGDGGGKDRGGG